jgi:uncharacterized delta-60 repeat protein
VTWRRLVLVCSLAVAAAAPAAARAAEVAPGRVVFGLDAGGVVRSVDPFGLGVGAGLPDGGAVLAGVERGRGLVLAQLRADGSLDPAFGRAGIARVAVPFGELVGSFPKQVLRRPGGEVLVVATGPAVSRYELQRLVVVQLTADGRPDAGFGRAGVAILPIQGSCGDCSPAALAPDGALVVTGNTGRVPPTIEGDPTVGPDFTWVAARVRADGTLDPAFGDGGVATLPGRNGTGHAAAVLPDGAIAALGRDDGGARLARLTASGRLDPTFNAGTPMAPPGAGANSFSWGLRGRPDGSVDLLRSGGGDARLARITRAGELDAGFGSVGVVDLPGGQGTSELLGAPDGGLVVAGPRELQPPSGHATLQATRVAADGRVLHSAAVPLPFGGGLASIHVRHRAPRATSLDQTGFRPGRPFARADGGLLVPGAVGVIRYTGEGAGLQRELAAVAALTPGLALDRAFGGAARPARLRIRVPAQRAALAAHPRLLRVAVDAITSGPGLCVLRVVDARGRTIAHSTAAAFSGGPQRLRALLTVPARSRLRRAHGVRVRVTATFRDVLGAEATARASGKLR